MFLSPINRPILVFLLIGFLFFPMSLSQGTACSGPPEPSRTVDNPVIAPVYQLLLLEVEHTLPPVNHPVFKEPLQSRPNPMSQTPWPSQGDHHQPIEDHP